MSDTSNKLSEAQIAQKNENWRKFWKIMKLMPLTLIMPMTYFGKMQEVIMGPDPRKPSSKPPTDSADEASIKPGK